MEDEDQLARNIKKFLESFKGEFEVTLSGDGETGLRKLGEAAFDYLLVDYRLPGINGLEVMREAFALDPTIRAIMMTAFPSKELRSGALGTGAIRFLEKPVDLTELRLLLWELVESVGRADPGLTVEEFIELLALGGESGAYRFRFAKDEGVVVVERGRPVHTATTTLKGAEALTKMKSWIVSDVEEISPDSIDEFDGSIELSVRSGAPTSKEMDNTGAESSLPDGDGIPEPVNGPEESGTARPARFSGGSEGAGTVIADHAENSPRSFREESDLPNSGRLEEHEILGLFRRLCNRTGTWKLVLRNGEYTAEIYFSDGALVHAVQGSSVGEDVTVAVLSWDKGEFTVAGVGDVPRRSLTREWSDLFLRAFSNPGYDRSGRKDSRR